MTKYSAPSIEVVNFSSSDAPRIGMQWFYSTGTIGTTVGPWNPVPVSGWVPTDLRDQRTNIPEGYMQGVNATSYWGCYSENIPGTDSEAIWTSENDPSVWASFVADDGRSC